MVIFTFHSHFLYKVKMLPIVTQTETPAPFDALFTQLSINATTYAHPQTFTVEESRAWEHLLPGGHTKNLFLRDKKEKMYLVTAIADTVIDLKKLADNLGAGRFSFGSADRLLRYLGVTPGSVTPLAVLNDLDLVVQPVLDSRLFDHDLVNFHPLRNDRTTAMTPQALEKFIEHTGHHAIRIDFTRI